nr:MAG TPA: hypothetical protein [Caudoviricetes sp.]
MFQGERANGLPFRAASSASDQRLHRPSPTQ